jgi:hypothetical protein
MRLTRFLYEGDSIKKALEIEEPAVGEEYSDEEIKWRISSIKDAIDAQKKNGIESEVDNSLLKDLTDKLEKWENVDQETKPAGPVIPALDVLVATVAPEPPGESGGEEDKKKTKKK